MKAEEVIANALKGYGVDVDTFKFRSDVQPITSALAEAGFVIVPKEPTEAMIGAGDDGTREIVSLPTIQAIYVAMITAAESEG